MKRAIVVVSVVFACAAIAGAQVPLLNADIETNAAPIFGEIDDWGPSGGWADHATFTIGQGRLYDPSLLDAFGFYSVNNDESVGQLTSTLIAANTDYSFTSWGQGGGNDVGEMIYEIGYADGAGDFALLASATSPVGREWELQPGASYTSGATGPEIGQPLWVRLGPGNPGTPAEDVWFDNFVATPEPASLLLIGLGALAIIRRRN